jgi:hypothetical protein
MGATLAIVEWATAIGLLAIQRISMAAAERENKLRTKYFAL